MTGPNDGLEYQKRELCEPGELRQIFEVAERDVPCMPAQVVLGAGYDLHHGEHG